MLELTMGAFFGALLGLLNVFPLLPLGLLYNFPVSSHLLVGVIVGYEASSTVVRMLNYLNSVGASENPQIGEAILSLLKKGRGLDVVLTVGHGYVFFKCLTLFVCWILVVTRQTETVRVPMMSLSLLGVAIAAIMWLVIVAKKNWVLGVVVFFAGLLISVFMTKLNSQYSMLALSTSLFSVGGLVNLLGSTPAKLPAQREGEAIEAGDPGFSLVGLISGLFIGIPTGVLVEAYATLADRGEETDYRDDLDWAATNSYADGVSSGLTLFMGLMFGSTRAAATTGFSEYSLDGSEVGALLWCSIIITLIVYFSVLPSLANLYLALFSWVDQRLISLVQIGTGVAIVLVSMGALGLPILLAGVSYQITIKACRVRPELALVPMSLVPLVGFVV